MMSQEYFEHITKAGDRWDLIAFQYYGDAKLIDQLLLMNSEFLTNISAPAPLVLDAGLKIRVPILSEDVATAAQLPPWKRP